MHEPSQTGKRTVSGGEVAPSHTCSVFLVAGVFTLLKVLLSACHPPLRQIQVCPPSSSFLVSAKTAIAALSISAATHSASPGARSNTLLLKARRIASVINWNLHAHAGVQPYQDYFWAGKEKVFFFRSDAKIVRLLCIRDLLTGKERQYRKVSKMWSDDGWFKQDIAVSPDGQRVCWTGDYRARDHSYHGNYVARLDGSQKFHIADTQGAESSWSWLPDGNLLEMTGTYDEQTGTIPNPKAAIRYVSSPHRKQNLSRKQGEFYNALNKYASQQTLSGGRVILAEEHSVSREAAHYDLKEMAINAEPTLLRHWEITLSTPDYLTIAPDGRHLAWFHRIPGTAKNAGEISLCMSRIDGSQKREIGQIKMSSFDENYVSNEYPRLLKWLPDSKRVSFLYRDTLYTAPK